MSGSLLAVDGGGEKARLFFGGTGTKVKNKDVEMMALIIDKLKTSFYQN